MLRSFDGTGGQFPLSGLFQTTNGTFYGTTFGGTNGDGTVFTLGVGLGPLIETVPAAWKAGTPVAILENDLGDAAHVRFNPTGAEFKLVSGSEIQTSVPDGASTGFVMVTRHGSRLKSNAEFQVSP